MKNQSFKYPFPTIEDKLFDFNNDNRLDTIETMFRDMHLEEMEQKAEESQNKKYQNPHHIPEAAPSGSSNTSLGKLLLNILGVVGIIIAFIPIAILAFCFFVLSLTNDSKR